MTSLNNRFEGLYVNYVQYRPRAIPTNEVALGFINAMKLQAIEDCDEGITHYTFTETEYEDSQIRLRIVAVVGAPQEQLVRCNLMYAIMKLAIKQLTREHLYGARFIELHNGHPLYGGVFDDGSDVTSLEQPSNPLAAPSETVVQDKQALGIHLLNGTNSTTTLLTIPGSNDVEYQMEYKFRGSNIPKVGIFSAILELLMTLAQRDSHGTIQNVSQVTSTNSIWIFVMRESEATFALKVFELLAILESVARYAVHQQHYQEMTFKFFINGEFVAEGCVTAPIPSRVWCQDFRAGGRDGLVGSFSSS